MKKVLGIFRGFPGLGRVVAGVSLLETLRDSYDCDVKFISYLQGNKYLESRGYTDLEEATSMDYCSIGLLPTNKMGVYIHNTIKDFMPDVIVVDGEPLTLQSIKISHPRLKVVALLNPADVDNPNNDKEAMDFFNALYSLSDLAIVHGLRRVEKDNRYKDIISINTIIRQDIITIKNVPTNNIYCVLGGGTVNAGQQFVESTVHIAMLCKEVAKEIPYYMMNIICSSRNIFKAISKNELPKNILLHNKILSANEYYCNACLIITRCGRNTLSELAHLGIPSLAFVTGDSYRREEQIQNIKNLNVCNLQYLPSDISVENLKIAVEKMIHLGKQNRKYEAGNQFCINKILSL